MSKWSSNTILKESENSLHPQILRIQIPLHDHVHQGAYEWRELCQTNKSHLSTRGFELEKLTVEKSIRRSASLTDFAKPAT